MVVLMALGPIGVGRLQIERGAVADGVVVAREPVLGRRPAEVAQLLEEAPGGVEARGGREGVELRPAVDAVHEHALVIAPGQFALVDQPRHEFDGAKLAQQPAVEGDLG